jgi:hypothetical protein
MLREMARQLPEMLERTVDVTSDVWGKLAICHGRGIEARIAAIRNRERVIRDNWLRRLREPPDWLLAEVEELAATRRHLEEENGAIVSQLDLAQTAKALLALLRRGLLTDISSKPPEEQAAWRGLISEARFSVGGTSGRGRVIITELIPLTRE